MYKHQAGKIAFMDFGGHLILNRLEYEESTFPQKPASKIPLKKEQKGIGQKVSSELPFC